MGPIYTTQMSNLDGDAMKPNYEVQVVNEFH
jgi:hypothetical protein